MSYFVIFSFLPNIYIHIISNIAALFDTFNSLVKLYSMVYNQGSNKLFL
jgi:hypothetical protein